MKLPNIISAGVLMSMMCCCISAASSGNLALKATAIGYGGHDEDQGQMGGVSALMKLGLFSLRGTSSKEPIYEITAPAFDEITIHLDPRYYSGKTFTIKTYNNRPDHMYIQKAKLNGRLWENCWIYHKDFARGGLLELWLGPIPTKHWGKSPVLNQLNKE
jgi:putative alpha-1,2-mannosidase